MSDEAHANAPEGMKKKKVALAAPVRAKIGEALEGMGYEVRFFRPAPKSRARLWFSPRN